MTNLLALVQNETIKLLKKKRFLVVILILAVLIPIFTYAQMKVAQNMREQFGTEDWRIVTQQQITDITNRIGSNRVPEEWKQWMRVRVQQLQYYLDYDVDPQSPNGVTFARDFMANAMSLFLPLMITVLAADLVSSEHSTGTIKLLLTRPVRRWKILLSKLIALTMFVSLTVAATGLLAYLIAGAVFGYGGWMEPVLTGFRVSGAELDTSHVIMVDQWLYVLMVFGLAWFACMTVACLSFMISVLVRSTAAGMGIMLAALIAGTILTNMASSWENAKYFFMVNLELTDYLSGALPPVEGMTLPFSLTVLGVWGFVSVIVAFAVFIRQDVMN